MRVEEIRKLIEILEESDLNEIEVARWWGWARVRVAKGSRDHGLGASNGGTAAAGAAPAAARVEPPPTQAVKPQAAGHAEIRSPMVGTFYRTPAPDAEPYVEVGQRVEVGQTVCIIEAMKLMNEIESDLSGRIVKVLVENQSPVEYGQPLFLVDSSTP